MYYIGLMSGTSADGIDAALVEFKNDKIQLIGQVNLGFSPILQKQIIALYTPGKNEIDRLGEVTHIISGQYTQAVEQLLKTYGLSPEEITALGCHGQTVRHRPNTDICAHPFTLQLLDPSLIASKTSITTVCDFRRKDMALGGEGAPLVPAFHRAIFSRKDTPRCIVNIGGIANVTFLDNEIVTGCDIGPGNALIDAWMQQAFKCAFDNQGLHAQQGQLNKPLLDSLLQHPFFRQTPPKSTGREEFTLAWLDAHIKNEHITDLDIIRTLTELTACTITQAIKAHNHQCEVFICGGGAHNTFLCTRIARLLGDNFKVASTKQLGVDPQHVEAMAFAWLAKQTIDKLPGNVPSVTGASNAAILGGIYLP